MKRIYTTYWWYLLFLSVTNFILSPFSMIIGYHFSREFFHYSILEVVQYATLTKVFSSSNWDLVKPFAPQNGAIWFLAIIVQIYVVVGLCMLLSKKRWQLSFLLFVLFLTSILTLIPSVKSVLPSGLFLPFFREFYIGIILYYFINTGLSPKSMFVTIFILFFLICLVFYCSIIYPQLLSLSFAITIGYIFLILHKYDYRISNLKIVRPLYIVGIFSYSLYLLNIPLYPLCGMFVRNLIPLSPSITFPLILIPSIILISFCWYLFFEKPPTQIDVIRSLISPIKTILSGKKFIQLLINSKSIETPNLKKMVFHTLSKQKKSR